MIYDWMKEDLVDSIDIDKIISYDQEEIGKAIGIEDRIKERIVVIRNTLMYSYFLKDHLSDIEVNYKATDDLIYNFYQLFTLCKVNDLRRYISVVNFEKIVAYIRYLKINNVVDRVDIRCSKLTCPVNPFPDIKADLTNKLSMTSDRSLANFIKGLIEKVNRCNEIVLDIEKLSNSLIEYEILNVYPEFDESKIGAFETLLGNMLEMFEASIEEIEEKEGTLEDWLDQLEMIETIVSDASNID